MENLVSKIFRIVQNTPSELESKTKSEEVVAVYLCPADTNVLRYTSRYTKMTATRVKGTDSKTLAAKFLKESHTANLSLIAQANPDQDVFVLYYDISCQDKVFGIKLM